MHDLATCTYARVCVFHFQFHFYTKRKYTNHILNILLRCRVEFFLSLKSKCSHLFTAKKKNYQRACSSNKKSKKKCSKTDHNYTMSIGVVYFRYMCENANDAKRKPIKLVFLPFCRDLNSEMARPSVLRFSIQQSKKRHQTTDLLLCVFLESTSTTTATTQTTHNYYFFCVRLFHILIE